MDSISRTNSEPSSTTSGHRDSHSFIKNGIGGAGNYRTLPPTQPPAPDLPRSFTSTYGTSNSSFSSGRGGSGNIHASHEKARRILDLPSSSTPSSSFSSASSSSEIAPKRPHGHGSKRRGILPAVVTPTPEKVSNYRHCGIGGAGNVKPKPANAKATLFASRSPANSSESPRPYYARNPPPPVSGADMLSFKLKNAFVGLGKKRGKGDVKGGSLPQEMVIMQGPYDLGSVADRPPG